MTVKADAQLLKLELSCLIYNDSLKRRDCFIRRIQLNEAVSSAAMSPPTPLALVPSNMDRREIMSNDLKFAWRRARRLMFVEANIARTSVIKSAFLCQRFTLSRHSCPLTKCRMCGRTRQGILWRR